MPYARRGIRRLRFGLLFFALFLLIFFAMFIFMSITLTKCGEFLIIGTGLITLILLITTLFYAAHYYKLENGIDKLLGILLAVLLEADVAQHDHAVAHHVGIDHSFILRSYQSISAYLRRTSHSIQICLLL